MTIFVIAVIIGAYLLGRYHQFKSDQKKVQGNLNKLL